ncbi:S9 family peptidase [Longirhabdus pacifica]|uniref:S9 family peptidase n=1 Tax=Longirhabdus pacifica TaxID=2305227 RepID=UPI00100876BF|nr:prolyl oligopeptidase family serine peptidase [Longirhabdus pacifica]
MITFQKTDVEKFFNTKSITTFSINHDETQCVFSTNFTGKQNLWAMDLPHTYPYQITFQDQSTQYIVHDKKGEFIIAGMDRDGDENTQLYAIPPQGGELVPISVEEGEKHSSPMLSADGKKLYFTSTKNNPTYFNLYCYDFQSEEISLLHEGQDAPMGVLSKSPDDSSFVLLKILSNTEANMVLLKNGEEHHITTTSVTTAGAVFTSDNELYYTTTENADFGYLAKFDLNTMQSTTILALEKEDFTSLSFDKQNQCIYIVAGKGVVDHLYRYDLHTQSHTLVSLPVDCLDQIKVAESGNLYVLGRSANKPHNLYMQKVEGETWTPLSNINVPGVSIEEMVEPDVISYPSVDGLQIEALLFKPKPEVDNGHIILWPHGGPQASERKNFRALFQFITYSGYTLFAPNFRGSSDYGLSFMKMVERNWGAEPRLDNIAGLEYLFEHGLAERDKVFLMGGSYGGYMALLLHGRHSEYFKAIVDICGPSNLFSFIDTVPEHWKPLMDKWVGNTEKDKDLLMEFSPHTYVDGMTKPMMIIQGANDPRVVKAESDQIVQQLKDKGREVKYIVMEDEGHGFSKKKNEIKVYREILKFFNSFL